MFINMAAEIIKRLEHEFKQADPAEKEHLIKSTFSLLQTIIADSKKNI